MVLRTISYLVPAIAYVLWLSFQRDGSISSIDPETVLKRGLELTSRSWEYGTLVQAMLELHHPTLTVFGEEPFPGGRLPSVPNPATVPGLQYAKSVIWINQSDLLTNGEGKGKGSPADPASLGSAALLLGASDEAYNAAAKRQAEYLINQATRYKINSTHSAISHRDEPPELWGDFIYMVPPFLAYYGVATQDFRILSAAVQQCQLYDEVLGVDVKFENGSVCSGLWRHIVSQPPNLPHGVCCSDTNVWLTSNAWAMAGITRVLATIMKWQPLSNDRIQAWAYKDFSATSKSLLAHILTRMLDCAMGQLRDSRSGLLKNYLDGSLCETAEYAYGDAAGTALMAAAVYRLAVLLPETFGTARYVEWAENNRMAVSRHVDRQGKVSPVADVSHVPSKEPAEQTSEGQSMVLLMYSAHRDWKDDKVSGHQGWNNVARKLGLRSVL